MRLTQIHLAYWQARRVPQWASALDGAKVDAPPDIHACINEHAAPELSKGFIGEPSNMLALLWHAREYAHLWNLTPANSVRSSLQRMASGSPTHPVTGRRARYATRWLARIEQESLARAVRDVPLAADALKNSGPANFLSTVQPLGRRMSGGTIVMATRYQTKPSADQT